MSLYFFAVFLVLAAWQDLWRRGIERRILLLFGILGIGNCIVAQRAPLQLILALMPGALLLLLSRAAQGAVGEGDGWFFIVSGLYLSFRQNWLLILSGLFFSAIYSLILTVMMFSKGKRIGKKRFPFLPFLVPVGLGLCFL